MPTKRPRVTLTETDALARRLDLAAAHFPARASSRTDLLLALTEVAEGQLTARDRDAAGARRQAAKARALALTADISADRAEVLSAEREGMAASDTDDPYR